MLLNLSYGLKIRGRKNLRKLKNKGFITISNHVHILDCVMVALALNQRKITFTSLSSNFDIPVAGHLVKALGVIPTPGDIYQTELFLNNCKRILSTNKILHIYPEGHLIPYYNGLRDFNKGAFKIANKNEAPLLPIVISWRKRKGLFRLWLREKPCININICEPVFPDYTLPKQNQEKYLKEECFKRMLEQYNKASTFKVVRNNTLERMSKLEAEKMLLDLLDEANEKIISKLNQKQLAKANKGKLKKDKILLLINQINELKDEA